MDDNVTTFKMKRSAAWNARQDFKSLVEIKPLPIESCWEILQRFFVDSDIVESWTHALNRLFEDGNLYLSEQQRMDFLSDATIQFSKKATFELDPVSRLLVMGSGSEPETTNWFMRFPDCLVSNFKIQGTFGCIEGLPRSGKTSLGCNFIKILGEVFHQKIITNIAIDSCPEYITQVGKLSDLVIQMVEKGKFTAILDETAIYIPKKRALSGENIDFEALARFIGKWRGNLIVISHSFERDIPSILQEWTTERYKKIDLDKVKVDLSKHGGFINMHKMITGVPDTDLKFITEDTTALKFDVSISKMLNEIQDVENYKQKPKRIIEWIKDELEHKDDKKTRQGVDIDDILNRINNYMDEGLNLNQSIKNVSNEFNLSYNTIQQYYYRHRHTYNK